MGKKIEYKRTRLQQDKNGQYRLTIPEWCVLKVLDAKKGEFITFDFNKIGLILNRDELQ
jgi:hypothetical protein